MTYPEALEYVTQHIQKHHSSAGLTAKIYDWGGDNRPYAGVRVAEVSFASDHGGCSYMQVDLPYGLAVCAQTERCIIAMIEEWDMAVDGDGWEEFWRLDRLFEDDKVKKS